MSGPCIASFITLIGTVSITEDGDGRITGVYLPNDNLPPMEEIETDTLREAASQINGYLSGKRRTFDLDIHTGAEGFRARVLEAIVDIPYGETRTYAEVAEMAGSPKAYRAVGTACSTNPLPIIIPCHRVVPSNGGIGQYTGGTSLKRRLLDHEVSDR